MKTPRIVNAIGYVDEELISSANVVATETKKNVRYKWSVMIASLCFALIVAFSVPKFISQLSPQDEKQDYGNTISYVGWTDNQILYDNALNKDLLQSQPNDHLPMFKMDTVEQLEQFKNTFNSVFDFNTGYDSVLSFNGALSKAQWEREAFFKDNTLIIVYIPTNDSSLRFFVQDVITTDNSICISIQQKSVEQSQANDKAGWFLLMQVTDEEINKYTSFDAVHYTKP